MDRWSRFRALWLTDGLVMIGFAVVIWTTVRWPVRLVALVLLAVAALSFLLAWKPPATWRR